ncbi:acyl-CoA thioesterase [Roseomonas marmotae]|uniref:Acyl-CoA thioesterase n=1 Tax=Roseomonas marmotae TaxID=2768161 RepID=A0ABS3KD65_9PROT|nr:acyl-CoA thioesterase [Roseomonas marmotae]MBO1074942.1 acyl-CoA thioesterase [Roseomonas marmotae]QTI80015.1 acyl-CoA thioesterase [Roseomonas marmotae]
MSSRTEPADPPQGAPVIRITAMPQNTNPAGDIFGGWLMGLMDLAGASAATRRVRGRCATVAVEAMSFISPVRVGDEVSCYAEVISTGRTSLKVRVEAWRREQEGDHMNRVTDAVFTFVALDQTGRPRPVPAA